MDGNLRVRGNDALTDLTGLDALTLVAGDVDICCNDVLASNGGDLDVLETLPANLDGFDALASIGGTLDGSMHQGHGV